MNEQYENSSTHILSHFPLPVSISGHSEKPKQKITIKQEKIDFNHFREEIYQATEKKLLLANDKEIKDQCRGEFLFWGRLKETKDIPLSRGKIGEVLKGRKCDYDKTMNLLLAISELTTNVIKHAEKGYVSLFETTDEFICCIRDKGPGFSIKDLQHKTLVPGYSTKESLGFGLNIVLKLADLVLLSNTESGAMFLVKFSKRTYDDSLRLVR
jgi:anti-sigma regulatory factor (Ser/Thr protein kinase)